MKRHPCNNKRHQKILQAYEHNLRQVVGLSAKTCQDRLRDVRRFLEAVPIGSLAELAELTPDKLVGYLTPKAPDWEPACLRNIAGSVRDFLPFGRQQGGISA